MTSIGERLRRAAVGADGRDGAVQLGRPAGGQHDVSAMRGKRGGGCQADAASRPGHQRPAAVERKPGAFGKPVNVYSAAVA